jgi:hypothetical protein
MHFLHNDVCGIFDVLSVVWAGKYLRAAAQAHELLDARKGCHNCLHFVPVTFFLAVFERGRLVGDPYVRDMVRVSDSRLLQRKDHATRKLPIAAPKKKLDL